MGVRFAPYGSPGPRNLVLLGSLQLSLANPSDFLEFKARPYVDTHMAFCSMEEGSVTTLVTRYLGFCFVFFLCICIGPIREREDMKKRGPFMPQKNVTRRSSLFPTSPLAPY